MKFSLVPLAALAASALCATNVDAQTLGCSTGGTGGPIPTSGTGGGTFPGTLPPAPSTFTLNVASLPAGATVVTEVRLLGLTHTYVTDLQWVLTDPSGVTHNVFCRPLTPTGGAFTCDYGGNYTFVPACTVAVTPLPATCTTTFAPGTYDQLFGSGVYAWPSGTHGIMNTRLDAIPAATGVWTLTCHDWAGIDTGALTSWDLCFGTPSTPSAPTAAPTLTSPANGSSLFGPTVNLVWAAANCATAYDIDVDGVLFSSGSNTFAYSSTTGTHTWMVRGKNASGVGPWSGAFTFNDLGPAPTPCNGPSVATIFSGGNGLGAGSCVFFDVNVTAAAGITVAELDTNASGTLGNAISLDVYTRAGSYVGNEQSQAGWTQVSTGSGFIAGANTASLVDVADFPLAQGTTGFCVVISGGGHSYTNGNGSNQLYSNADLSISLGKSQATPFTSTPFEPRVWNGRLRYNCGPTAPVVYCTSGTSTNGCLASIAASAQPSATLANPCVLSVSNVEGQKSGIMFYGLDNTGFTPSVWGNGGNSFLCVKASTQRMAALSSGGTVGLCDGTLTQSWNAFQAANPTALGNPFSAGQKVYAQAWYRDPPAVKTTNLSNAVELTMQP